MGLKILAEELFKRAKAKGYSYSPHQEKDSKRDTITHKPKIIRDQDSIMKRYNMYEGLLDYVKRFKLIYVDR